MSDSHQVFQCPNCQQFISTKNDTCRFCSLPLSDELKAQAIEKETENNRQYRFKNSKIWFFTGIGVFALGILLLAYSFFSINVGQGYLFYGSPIITLIGLGQMLGGLIGMGEERKKKKKNV